MGVFQTWDLTDGGEGALTWENNRALDVRCSIFSNFFGQDHPFVWNEFEIFDFFILVVV